jgi:WD40 repeat protein
MEEPYVGLGHFTEAYADRFFGRDTECSLIIGNLRAARLTLLYAESGVGKSSVLRAGVLARLHGFADNDLRVRGSPRLVPVVFSSWSEAPVAALITALGEAARPYLAEDAALELPEGDLEAALEAASAALDATLLVVLDQFEEYFLYPDEQPQGKRVADQIARCVNRADLRANFLISIREDSYARLGDLFRGKVTNVYANFLHLDFLDRDGARESIEKPIARVNELQADGSPYELEPELVDAVLDQVGRGRIEAVEEDGHRDGGDHGDEVETTYLQLVMRRLWEEETEAGSHHLRLQTLEDLGGAQAVITSHLDRAMDDDADGASLTDAQRLVAASIFHFLVTSGGTKIALTARDLSDLSGRPLAEIDPVLQHLSSPALHILRPVVSENGKGEPRFEIFHDALARPIVEWRTRVEEAELGKRLKRERAEKESAQKAAADAKRREARERRRKRGALIVLGVVLAFLALFGLLALAESDNLAKERKDVEQSVRAVERITELARAPSIFSPAAAAVAGIAAHELSPTIEARDVSLGQLQLNPGMPEILTGHTRSVNTVAYWPGSGNLASGGDEGTVRLWDSRGRELGGPLVSSGTGESTVNDVAVSSTMAGTRIVAAATTREFGAMHIGSLELWRIDRSGRVLPHGRGVQGFLDAERGLAFDPRVPTVLAIGSEFGIELWDVANPRHPQELAFQRLLGGVNDLAFAPDGRSLLVATATGGVEVKLAGTEYAGGPAVPLVSRPMAAVAVAPNGSYAFGGSRGIVLWDAVRHRRTRLATDQDIRSLAFARGGSVLVSGGAEWNVITWDVASGRPFGPPRAAEHAAIRDVAVGPGGDRIAAASGEGLVKVWPLEPSHPLAATVASFSPADYSFEGYPGASSIAVGDGGRLALAAGTAGASIWKLRSPADPGVVPRPLARIPGDSYAVAYKHNLLALGHGFSFRLAETGAPCRGMPSELCHWTDPPPSETNGQAVGLSLRSVGPRLLLAAAEEPASGGGFVSLWDVTEAVSSGRIVHLSSSPIGAGILSLAFSGNGSLLAAGTKSGKLQVWDARDPRHPKGITVERPEGEEAQPVAAVAFPPKGTLLAAAGANQQVMIWKVLRHGSGLPTVEQTAGNLFQSQTIESLAFSPDGKTLAAGDGSGRTCLYQVGNRNSIGGTGCLVGHANPADRHDGISALRFTPLEGGGTVLLSGGPSQPVVAWSSDLWNLDDSDQADQGIKDDVCRLSRRNLTKDEWDEAFGATSIADDRDTTCPEYPLP